MALKPCSRPGCPELVPKGQSRCDACTKAADRARGTASNRGYTTPGHRRFREEVLARDPICVLCLAAHSTVADHYPQSRRERLDLGLDPDDPDNGRGLCKPCHDRETAANQPGGWNA